MSAETPAMARWAARLSSVAAGGNEPGRAAPTAGSTDAASLAMRCRRCWKRQAPVTPASVHSRSRSGGLDAADILVDRHQVVVFLAVERRRLEPRRGEAIEVPARVDEGVERVGFALGRPAAGRAGDVLPGRMALERIARLVDLDVLGQ